MTKNTKKYAEADKRYVAERAALAAKHDKPHLWEIVDQWSLYAGVYSISRALAVFRLVEQSMTVPGHIAEIGCWRGANLMLMAKLLRILDPHSSKQVHGFDSFEGLQDFSPEDGKEATRGYYRGSLDELRDLISLYEFTDEVILHVGNIDSTIPTLLDLRRELSFSLIYIDVDLYRPTLIALEGLHGRLSVGGCFVLDEWNTAMFPGETVAVREFMLAHADSYRMENVTNTRQPNLVLRKIRP